jgi:hypothetical protein
MVKRTTKVNGVIYLRTEEVISYYSKIYVELVINNKFISRFTDELWN